MIKTNPIVASKEGASKLSRPKFGPGMLLHHDDLEQLNIYTRDLSRLMFRSLVGCGVICGLVVKPDYDKCGRLCITVEKGLGLSSCGDPVYVPKTENILVHKDCETDLPDELWVVLCGTEKCCAPRTSTCACDEDEANSVCTRERYGFEIRVLNARPECVCGCKDTTISSEKAHVTAALGGALEESDKAVLDRARARAIYTQGTQPSDPCWCADPIPCHEDHYGGICSACDCDCSGCECDCILLARLEADDEKWTADHSVRRFIRPVLIRDPQVYKEQHPLPNEPPVLAAKSANIRAAPQKKAEKAKVAGRPKP